MSYNTPELTTWRGMIRRCYGNTPSSLYYRDKGITVCDSWKSSFFNFLSDMGKKPEGSCIDRIDSSKNYCPENCRWAPASTMPREAQMVKTKIARQLPSLPFTEDGLCQFCGASNIMLVKAMCQKCYQMIYHRAKRARTSVDSEILAVNGRIPVKIPRPKRKYRKTPARNCHRIIKYNELSYGDIPINDFFECMSFIFHKKGKTLL